MGLNARKFYSDRSPTRWRDVNPALPHAGPEAFGFVVGTGEVNRWAARYRAAASFEGASFVQYQSQEIAKGYSALIRALLVWSAFERYLAIIGVKQKDCGNLLKP